MLDNATMTTLRRLVVTLHKDLVQQFDTDPELAANLKADHNQLRELDRTGLSFTAWSDGVAEQGAVAWVITCVFVRYLEDNGWLKHARISGRRDRLADALDRQQMYVRENPSHGETQYLLSLFEELAASPAGDVFSPEQTPVYALPISTGAARELLRVLRATDPGSDVGDAMLLFKVPDADTRVLGDLYEDLSVYARAQYALVQTPDFVEEYLLEHTLVPAIDTFGLDAATMVDPTCGSGHIVLGAFHMLYEACVAQRPNERTTNNVNSALRLVHGVDINPFAAAIARFRLLLAASWYDNGGEPVEWSRIRAFDLNIGCADALLGPARGGQRAMDIVSEWKPRAFLGENQTGFDILSREYAVVVGNPPYITPKEEHLRNKYRELYSACSGKYSLVVPFTQRFFELAHMTTESGQGALALSSSTATSTAKRQAGYVGAIVANSFAKREFGKLLVRKYLPSVDLTHIIDTSGAYIPGNGTPTLILFGRHRQPTSTTIRAVLGTRGEPSQPADPTQGKVWRSIADHTNQPGFENDFISVVDMKRSILAKHPWTLRGSGALEALQQINKSKAAVLDNKVTSMGFGLIAGEDEVFAHPGTFLTRYNTSSSHIRQLVTGEYVRDYGLTETTPFFYPYDGTDGLSNSSNLDGWFIPMWAYRTLLWERKAFNGKSYRESGRTWYEYHQFPIDRLRPPLTITFGEVATHNHFVLDRGGKVFKQTAPIIKLPESATVNDHLRLIGLLNSSVGDFWARMYFQLKGGDKAGDGARVSKEPWEDRLQRDSTKLKSFPLAADADLLRPAELDSLANELAALEPAALVARPDFHVDLLTSAQQRAAELRQRMIALQEELDWLCYERYGLWQGSAPLPIASDEQITAGELPTVALGERAFEIALARKVKAGTITTQWFKRHGSKPRTTIPDHWPRWYQELVQQRLNAIESNRFVRLIEDCEFKRRWNDTPWADREKAALQSWMLDWLESTAIWPHADRNPEMDAITPRMRSTRELSRLAQNHATFYAVAMRYTGQTAPDMERLIYDLVTAQAVPLLPRQRLKPGGLRKYREWERVWELQRREDAIDARTTLPEGHRDYLSATDAAALKKKEVGTIKPAPKYTGADFAHGTWYSLRGKLDVPRERFILLPDIALDGGAEQQSERGVATIGWAGWSAEQRTRALVDLNERALAEGWPTEQRQMLLAGIVDQLPWVEQWHNEPDEFGSRPADELRSYVRTQCEQIGCTIDELQELRRGGRA